MIIFGILLIIYLMSVIFISVWDRIVSKTGLDSWIDNTQTYMPVYNTALAYVLWRDFNPFS